MSNEFDFDSGLEEGVVVQGGGKVKNEKIAAAGDHMARIRSIVHLGQVESFYNGESKGVCPRCVIVFELKEDDDFETDGETALTITKDIDIKKGDKANISLLLAAFKTPEGNTPKNFDEMINSIGTVTVTHSRCGKYANVAAFNKGGVSSLHQKMFPLVGELQGGVGNVKFSEMTTEALEECHAWNHVADQLMVGITYEGSKAQGCVEAIRAQEGREDYAKKDAPKKAKSDKPAEEAAPASAMDEDEEY